MAKRFFAVLDEMNAHDIEHNTRFISLHPDVVNVGTQTGGNTVTMGVPKGIIDMGAIAAGSNKKQRIVLMIVDGEEYDKRMKE